MKNPPAFFEETAIGAVVLVAVQFLSLPILIVGLGLLGLARFLFRSRPASE